MGVGPAGWGAVGDLAGAGSSPYTAIVPTEFVRGGGRVSKTEKRLAAAYCRHTVESVVPGYFVCYCGCGYRGVCRHCVPDAPLDIPWVLCEQARALVASGQARCEEGYVYAVGA